MSNSKRQDTQLNQPPNGKNTVRLCKFHLLDIKTSVLRIFYFVLQNQVALLTGLELYGPLDNACLLIKQAITKFLHAYLAPDCYQRIDG